MNDSDNQSPPAGTPSSAAAQPSLPPALLGPPPPERWERIFIGPHGIRAGWSAAVFLMFLAIFLFLAAGVLWLFDHSLPVPGHGFILTPAFLFSQELLSAAAALGATAVMGRLERRRFADFGLPPPRAFRGRFWQGWLFGLLQISALMAVIAAWHGFSFGALALSGASILRYALEWGAGFLLVGLFEESCFRGYLQATLARGMGFWPAALLLSAGFGAVHLTNPGEGRVGAASVFVVGLFLCFTLWRTGNLWFAIGWHAAWDFGETYLYSVPDSGLVPSHALLASSLHGPAWLTGGSVGPEGSVFAFASMALGAVVFGLLYRPRPSTSIQP